MIAPAVVRPAPVRPAKAEHVSPLYRGYGSSSGFCRMCYAGFALTPTYGNPARCPDCDAYMRARAGGAL